MDSFVNNLRDVEAKRLDKKKKGTKKDQKEEKKLATA